MLSHILRAVRFAIGSCDTPVTFIAHATIIPDVIFTVRVITAAGQWIAIGIVGGAFIDVLAITVFRVEGIAIITNANCIRTNSFASTVPVASYTLTRI